MKERLLVLCVDRDNDIGRVGIDTPIVGEENVLKAAVDFALKRPEDSDANALFVAIKEYRKLRSEGKDVEVAVIAGDAFDDVKAGMKIREELKEVLSRYPATGVIMVSDGVDDELILPVIESLVPVVSIKRVVVEQLRGVEETYVLIGRYLKKILETPKLSRIFLGVPGLIILSLCLLSALGLLQYASLVTGAIIGLAMLVKGFNLDEAISHWWESSPVMFASAALSLISLTIGGIVCYMSLPQGSNSLAAVASNVIYVTTPFIAFSFLALLTGKLIVKVMRRDLKLWHEVVGMLFVVFLVMILYSAASALAILPPNPTVNQVVEAISKSGLINWLFITIGVVGALTIFFTVVERWVTEET